MSSDTKEEAAREREERAGTKTREKAERAAERAREKAERGEERARDKAERAAERDEEKLGRAEERADAKLGRNEERVEEKAGRAQEKVERAEDQVRRHSERADQQVARALQRVTEAEDRAGEKVARALKQVERAEGGSADDGAGELIWFRQEPASRRPAHTRADIARAAVEIADSEGFESVSMRRVAQRLGAGTMTLYHYVRNKDELISLMGDSVMAEVVVPDGELPGGWREALTLIAKRTHDAFAGHHWIFQQMSDTNPGPNGMRHFEQSLEAVEPLDLDREHTFEVIGQIDDYVFGYALREVQDREEQERGWGPEVQDFFHREVATGRYPRIEKYFGDDLEATFDSVVEFMSRPDRFDRGLERLLDGIEAEFAPE